MTDIERRLQQTFLEQLDRLEMPDRLASVRKRAQRRRLVSMTTIMALVVGALASATVLINTVDRPEITDEVAMPTTSSPESDGETKDKKEASECPDGIEGDGLERGEPRPPQPYFYPHNTWRMKVGRDCVTVIAGAKGRYDQENAREHGTYRRGALLLMDESGSFTTRDQLLFAPLPAPIRIVDVRGQGMESELVLQSLVDCSLASFRLLSQDFESTGGDYQCTADDASGHDQPTYVVADCFEPELRPQEIIFTCATADFRATELAWQGWNPMAASARGNFECYGTTCQWERTGTIALSKRGYCEDLGKYVFMEGRVVLDSKADGQRVFKVMPGCGLP